MAEHPSELTFIFQGTTQGEGSRKAQKSAINRHVSRTTHQKRRQQRCKALHSHSHSQDKKDGPPDKLLADDAAAAAAAALVSSEGGEQSPDDGPSTYFAQDSAKSENTPDSSSTQSKPETSSSESVGLDKSLPGSDNDNDNVPEDSGSRSAEDPGQKQP
ncbi:hypothetical protein PV10_08486 [Exophiala mesophila]|uniref:Uncharacterized protein n=1 Tax=Exophiala mesophila TaxID=212818 RepID=A0A0D1ZPW4_EXOME|nr:uncharacterized protein PV10_08486 [Exophiala mesophila]KIV88848.1 hypothetical protein PV10_08486 [Exophiala mesophila]